MYNISKKLKFQINKKFVKNNNIVKEYDLKLQNDILYKVFESLQLDINDNSNIYNEEFYKIVKEIYSNYLYINDNHKFQNQRVLSNENNLFESLCKLFKDSYEYTENQFKKYFNLFIESFNDLFVLIDIKIYGDQINNQLIYNQIDKKNTKLKEETNNHYKNSLELIKNERKDFEEKNQKIINDFLLRYQNDSDENKLENYEKIEKEIQNNIEELSKKVNEQINYFNDIAKALNIQNQSIQDIKINYSDKILNKNSKVIESFVYKDGILDIFRLFGNIAIYIHNKRKEKKKLKKI
jgi:methyl-accepting chemotaxis protein